jgi:hypothetical protein
MVCYRSLFFSLLLAILYLLVVDNTVRAVVSHCGSFLIPFSFLFSLLICKIVRAVVSRYRCLLVSFSLLFSTFLRYTTGSKQLLQISFFASPLSIFSLFTELL